jgi:hypothetical protein
MPLIAGAPDKAVAEKMVAFRKISILDWIFLSAL